MSTTMAAPHEMLARLVVRSIQVQYDGKNDHGGILIAEEEVIRTYYGKVHNAHIPFEVVLRHLQYHATYCILRRCEHYCT